MKAPEYKLQTTKSTPFVAFCRRVGVTAIIYIVCEIGGENIAQKNVK